MALSERDAEVCAQVEGWLGFSMEPGAIRLIQIDYEMLNETEREVAFLYLLGQAIEAQHLAKALTYVIKEGNNGSP